MWKTSFQLFGARDAEFFKYVQMEDPAKGEKKEKESDPISRVHNALEIVGCEMG